MFKIQLMEHNTHHTPSYNLTALNKKIHLQFICNLLTNGFVTTNRKVKETYTLQGNLDDAGFYHYHYISHRTIQ